MTDRQQRGIRQSDLSEAVGPTRASIANIDRMHSEISDPRNSASCWSRAEVGTPDAVIHEIACARGRHRWGKHRNRQVRWACPPRCGCVRHTRSNSQTRENL